MAEGPSLADLGEWEVIRRLGAFAPPGQFLDDAALIDFAGDGRLVLTTDVLVEGVHFSEVTTTPADVGWRAAAANLSDLAAMGCRQPLGLTVGLVAPDATPWSWVQGVYEGMVAALARHGGVLLGGDCSGGRQRLLAITALGRLSGEDRPEGGAIRRGDGRPGDRLVSTGFHGLSRLGLALLQGSHEADRVSQSGADLGGRAVSAHRRPQPRLDAVGVLAACRPATQSWRVGGCDSSDGLAAAVVSIAAASGCAALLERRQLPIDPAMADLPEAETWCLGGGEDFELVLALPPQWAEALIEALPGAQAFGSLVASPTPGMVGWSDGGTLPSAASGFRHFG
jgi:thiamine-monophosphate kinase